MSADGKSVYATSYDDDAVARFDRSPAGDLSYQGCISGNTAASSCTQIPGASSGGTSSGLDRLFWMAASADGKSVYTASFYDDAVARFDRSPAGDLSYQGCISGDTAAGSCTQIPSASSGGTNSGLDLLRSVTTSADGKSVYAASQGDDAVAGIGRISDTTAPKTTITKEPKKKTSKRTATFKFKANEAGASFECKLDKKPFKPCHSPKKYKHLKPGRHTFRARATDGAGNTCKAARYAWKVKG